MSKAEVKKIKHFELFNSVCIARVLKNLTHFTFLSLSSVVYFFTFIGMDSKSTFITQEGAFSCVRIFSL